MSAQDLRLPGRAVLTGVGHLTTLPPLPRRPPTGRLLLAAVLILLALISGAYWISTQYRIGQVSRGLLSRSYERRIAIADLMMRLQALEAGHGHPADGGPVALRSCRSSREAILRQRRRLEGLLVDVPDQSARYAALAGLIDRRISALDAAFHAPGASSAPVGAVLPGQDGTAQAQRLAATMMGAEDRMIAERSRRWDERVAGTQRLLWLLAAAAFVLTCAGLAVTLFRRRSRYPLALQAQEAVARLTGVFDGTNDAIVLLDPDGRIEAVNPAVTRLLGYQPVMLTGRDIAMLVDVLPPVGSLAERIGLEGGGISEPLRIDRVAYHRDGHSVPVDVALGLMPMATGLHVVAAIRDISERKAIDRMKDEFIATASHELRTPLTSVVGALGLLRTISGTTLSEPARRLVTVAEENSRRMIDLVNDLLDLEKLDSGALALRSRPIDLVPILRNAARGGEGLAAERGVAIAVEVPPDGLPMAGDEGRLARVVTNLLANAIRFSPDYGTVTLSAERRSGRAVVTVADRGPGVPPAFRQRLFTRFAQAGDARSAGGSGLGLAISQQIVRAHGGTIWFEPRPGGGACFRFSIALRAGGEATTLRLLVCGGPSLVTPDMVRSLADQGIAIERAGPADAVPDRAGHDAILIDLDDAGAGEDALAMLFGADATMPVLPVIVRAGGQFWRAHGVSRDAWRTTHGGAAIADIGALIRADRRNAGGGTPP